MELFLHIIILCRYKSNLYVFMRYTDENNNKVMQKLGPTQLAILRTDLKKQTNGSRTAQLFFLLQLEAVEHSGDLLLESYKSSSTITFFTFSKLLNFTLLNILMQMVKFQI